MSEVPFTIKAYGAEALLLEWPNTVDPEILMDILGFRDHLLENHLLENGWELIPVYHSLTLINRNAEVRVAEFARRLPQWYSDRPPNRAPRTRFWELPVCYDPEFAPDLEEVSEKLGMEPQEVIEAHSGHVYRVYGIGFLPGFQYLGGVPEFQRGEGFCRACRGADGDLPPEFTWGLAYHRELPGPPFHPG